MRNINPSYKAIAMLLPALLLVAQQNPILPALVFFLCLIIVLVEKVNLRQLSLMLIPLVLTASGMFFTGWRFQGGEGVVNADHLIFFDSGIGNGLVLASRVLGFAGLGMLFVLTTDNIRLVYSLVQNLRFPVLFAYGLLAAWRLFPAITREYRLTQAAFRARGIRVFPVSAALLRPLLVKSVRWTEAISMAMESKGFSGEGQRTYKEQIPVTWRDRMFPLFALSVMAVSAYVSSILFSIICTI